MKRSLSKKTADAPLVFALIAAIASLCAPPGTAQASLRVEPVQVTFAIADWRYRESNLTGTELDEICAAARDHLASALQERIGHLEFQTQQGPDAKLACVMNTDTQGHDLRAAVRWFFTFTSSKLPRAITWDVEYLSLEDAVRPIPRKDSLLREVLAFIDGAVPTDPALREAGDRWSPVYNQLLAELPLFTNRVVAHVPATPLLAVNTPRSDYADTIPDASEFLLNMKVLIPGGALEQDYRLRARLLDAAELQEWTPKLEPAGLARGVVAKVVSCEPVAGCPPTAIDDITRSAKCTFVPPLKLVKLIPPKPRAVSPDAFQPPQ